MHRAPHAMPNELTNHTKTVVFNIALNGPRDIGHSFALHGLTNAFIKRFLSHINQLWDRTSAAHSNRPGVITDKSIIEDTDIDAHDITKLDAAVTG